MVTSPGSAVKSKRTCRDFPGGPVVKTLCFSCRGAWVQSLVQKLRSHMPLSQEKKKACMRAIQLPWKGRGTSLLLLEGGL